MEDNYCQMFASAASLHRDAVALQTFGGDAGNAFTYGEILDETYALACALKNLGIQRADRVGVIGENHPRWAMAYLGALFAEAVVVPLDMQLSVEELRNLLEDSGTRAIFSSPAQLEKVLAARDSLARPLDVICFGLGGARGDVIALEKFSETGRTLRNLTKPPHCAKDDVAILVYTSGTTGRPKGVMITHHNLLAQVRGVTSRLNVNAQDRLLGLLPLHHTYAQLGNFLMPLALGSRVTYLEKVSSQTMLQALRQCRITILIGVPQLYYLFHQRIFDAVRARPVPTRMLFRFLFGISAVAMRRLNLRAGKVLFRSIHQQFGGHIRMMASAGSSFDAKVARDLSALGFIILQGYGLTETSGAATITPMEQGRVGAVGVPIPGVQVAIEDPGDQGIGEVLIKGDVVMKGYYNRPDLTAEVIRDGWFHSGDLGYMDRVGLLYITGRKKDVIVLSNGKNIYPEEVEAHYMASPAIREMCVLGQTGEGRYEEEQLFAVVVPDFDYLRAHKIANAGEVIRYDIENLSKSLPKHKRILNYRIVSTPLPRTSTRKIKRFEVHKELQRWLTSGGGESPAAATAAQELSDPRLSAPIGQRVAEIMKAALPRPVSLSSESNIELDLGFDSLHRIELLSSIEEQFGVKFGEEQAAAIYTVGQLIEQTEALTHGEVPAGKRAVVAKRTWREILASASEDALADRYVLQDKPLTMFLAYLTMRALSLLSKILFRLELRGVEHLPAVRPYLICPNHQSFIDPFVISSAYPYSIAKDVFHLGATEYFLTAFTRWFARVLNVVPVDPDVNLYRAMAVAAIGLRHGKILNIYPEGSRTPDGELKEFKKGAAILATELRIPIVPVAISGAFDVWARASKKIHLAKVRVAFGPPIDVGKLLDEWGPITEDEQYTRVNEVLRDRVAQLLERMTPPGKR